MSPPTYRERVLRALKDITRLHGTSVIYDDLYNRVHENAANDGLPTGPKYKDHVTRVLKNLARARYVQLKVHGGRELVVFTARGIKFFQRWGNKALFDKNDPTLKKMSACQLREQCELLDEIIHEIQDVLLEHKPGAARAPDDLPRVVDDVADRYATSQQQLTDALSDLGKDRTMELKLRALL